MTRVVLSLALCLAAGSAWGQPLMCGPPGAQVPCVSVPPQWAQPEPTKMPSIQIGKGLELDIQHDVAGCLLSGNIKVCNGVLSLVGDGGGGGSGDKRPGCLPTYLRPYPAHPVGTNVSEGCSNEVFGMPLSTGGGGGITINPTSPPPFTLVLRQYSGRITITHGLTAAECEIERLHALGQPATEEERRAVDRLDAMYNGDEMVPKFRISSSDLRNAECWENWP